MSIFPAWQRQSPAVSLSNSAHRRQASGNLSPTGARRQSAAAAGLELRNSVPEFVANRLAARIIKMWDASSTVESCPVNPDHDRRPSTCLAPSRRETNGGATCLIHRVGKSESSRSVGRPNRPTHHGGSGHRCIQFLHIPAAARFGPIGRSRRSPFFSQRIAGFYSS